MTHARPPCPGAFAMIHESIARLTVLTTTVAAVARDLIGHHCGAPVPAAGCGAAVSAAGDATSDCRIAPENDAFTPASPGWQRLLLGRLTELLLSDDCPLRGTDFRALLALAPKPVFTPTCTELPPNFKDIVRQIYGVNLMDDIDVEKAEQRNRSRDCDTDSPDPDSPDNDPDRPDSPDNDPADDSHDPTAPSADCGAGVSPARNAPSDDPADRPDPQSTPPDYHTPRPRSGSRHPESPDDEADPHHDSHDWYRSQSRWAGFFGV